MFAVIRIGGARTFALAVALAALGLACSEASDGDRGAAGAGAGPADLEAPLVIPPRDPQFDDGAPDSCELLRAARPAKLFGVPMGPAQRMLSLCLADVVGWDGRPPERSAQLEIRKADARGVPTDLESFWAAEGAGVEFVGGLREGVRPLPDPGLGDLALEASITNGRRFYVYWAGEYILLLTVLGAPDPDAALAWSTDLIRASIDATIDTSGAAGSAGDADAAPDASADPPDGE